jgi:CubicO group peptidase (beta-lactamase class C family)
MGRRPGLPALEKSGVPGAIVVVVNRAGILLNKGYGVSDVAAKTPVDPDRSLFNTASVGKSMTGLIVAQLLEEGVLTLDVDVNRYLTSARIGGRDTVTLRMLLAHRGGFDDDITGLFVPFDGDITIPRDELDRRLRPLVKPGYATAYDNQGFGVIGLILRDVMKKPVPELYRERLFDPAGMSEAAHGRPKDGARDWLAATPSVAPATSSPASTGSIAMDSWARVAWRCRGMTWRAS